MKIHTLYHFASGNAFAEYREEQVITPAEVEDFKDRNLPKLVFLKGDDLFNESAIEILQNEYGFDGVHLMVEEAMKMGLYRIAVALSVPLIPWEQFVGLRQFDERQFSAEFYDYGEFDGGGLYVTNQSIPSSNWIDVDHYDGTEWKKLKKY